MDPTLTIATLVALPASFTAWAAIGWARARRRRARWARIAYAVKLPLAEGGLQGACEGCQVEVMPGGTVGALARVEVWPNTERKRELNLTLRRHDGPRSQGREHPTGDTTFDKDVLCHDWIELVLALDPAERVYVRDAVTSGWEFANGTWVLETRQEPKAVSQAVTTGIRLARTIADARAELPRRLCERVATDPVAAVRRTAFDKLVELGRARSGLALQEARILDGLETQLIDRRVTPDVVSNALEAALRDSDLDNRLHAARLSRDAATILALARYGFAPAVATLGEAAGPGEDEVRSVLTTWLARDPATLAPELVTELAHALGRLGTPATGAEAWLVERLTSPIGTILAAAIDALGAIGTLAALPPLTGLRDGPAAETFKHAARDAILSIQSRTGVEPGGLTFADAEGGELALTPAP